ncbi:1A family penicillin-binding protein [Alkalibacillus filiformis]|uniref:1A family penicillin-binding protein n=1 Tax=Alkalibacillus filiformis TaxID=200990 RepID=A0ABU0DVU9_9BACI|nr:PBP1A family penicillin-binding protein [Alkalibacillus filiformis]MDQ0352596.1 1A family penicillin-binding protein [Alkalibacillus filiformis]
MKKLLKRLMIVSFFSVVFLLSTIIVIFTYILFEGPPEFEIAENTVVYDQYDEVVSVNHGVESRYSVSLEDISPHVIDAFIAAEDQHFYDHYGFDFKRIVGAAYHNIMTQRRSQGASTITQQYARNVFLTHNRTWERKIQEALIALRLEVFQSKDEILEGYLNTIYFGHGQYGIEAASQFYFDKTASELSIAESALLASVPRGPSLYSPINNYERAVERQQWILSRMRDTGKIVNSEYRRALEESLAIVTTVEAQQDIGDYFLDYAMNEATNILDVTREELEAGGYQIHTTIDPRAQAILEEKSMERLPEDEEYQVGAVTLDHQTGKIVALHGGRNFHTTPFNRAVRAERMTGSAFKPFLYYAALVYGYTPSTTLESTFTQFTLEDGSIYDPSNYNDRYAERPVTLAQALAVSDNVYAVKTNMFMGPENLVESAELFGIEGDLKPRLPLALGTTSISPFDMTKAYSLIANSGWKIDPYIVEKIIDRNGDTVYQHQAKTPERVLDENYSFVLKHMMTGMFDDRLSDYLRVTGASISHALEHEYAGKSGTTENDAWMVGFSPNYTTAVWTGFDDHRRLETTQEKQAAKQIWGDYMSELHEGLTVETFKVPSGVTGVYMDPMTGSLNGPACEDRSRLTYYIRGTEPTEACEEIEVE